MVKIKNLKIIIASHEFTTGPAQNFEEYCLKHKVKKLLFLSHPLFYNESTHGNGWRYYEKGVKKEEKYLILSNRNSLINYLREFFLNLFWILIRKKKWYLYIGVDCLNALSGIFLRRLGKVKKVVFYSIDYVPKRFENKFLNNLYHAVEIYCVKHSDITWNLSPRMVEAREKFHHLSSRYRLKQILVPEGIWFERIRRQPFKKIDKHSLVFLGHLVARLGVQKAIEAVPSIVKKIPDFKFIIIGKGDYQKTLVKLAKDLKVTKYIEFKGFIKDHQDVEKIIAKCAVGIAPYSNEEKTLSYYCDPSKTKIYMGCGLPVIMTDVFYNAKEIADFGAGEVVEYNKEEIVATVVKLLEDKNKLHTYRENAVKYVKRVDWNIIFKENLNKL